MVIKENQYYINSDYPNTDFVGEGIVIEDGSELANKAIEYYPYFKLVMSGNEVQDVIRDEIKAKYDTNMQQINELKKQLTDSDYKAIKYAEGFISEEDYTSIKAQRQAWRDEINRLEAELNESTN